MMIGQVTQYKIMNDKEKIIKLLISGDSELRQMGVSLFNTLEVKDQVEIYKRVTEGNELLVYEIAMRSIPLPIK